MTRAKDSSTFSNFILRLSYADAVDSHNSVPSFQVAVIISECRFLKMVTKSSIYIIEQ